MHKRLLKTVIDRINPLIKRLLCHRASRHSFCLVDTPNDSIKASTPELNLMQFWLLKDALERWIFATRLSWVNVEFWSSFNYRRFVFISFRDKISLWITSWSRKPHTLTSRRCLLLRQLLFPWPVTIGEPFWLSLIFRKKFWTSIHVLPTWWYVVHWVFWLWSHQKHILLPFGLLRTFSDFPTSSTNSPQTIQITRHRPVVGAGAFRLLRRTNLDEKRLSVRWTESNIIVGFLLREARKFWARKLIADIGR